MKILWLSTSSMQLQPIIDSMRILFTSVSSMNLEPIVSGFQSYSNSLSDEFSLCKFDKGMEEQFHYEGEVDHVILTAFNAMKPDVVIYSGPAEGKCRPFLGTFHEMRKTAKIVNLVCDGGCPNWHPLLETYKKAGCFDLTVNIDGNDEWPKGPNDFTWIGPIDSSYYNKYCQKSIDCGFAGGTGSLSRREAIAKLQQSIELTLPERNESWGTYHLYADFMLSCKRVINFSTAGSGLVDHVKYRVLESGWAKCCLFEQKNKITPKYFVPGVEYLEYESIDDLVDKVKSMDISGYGDRLHAAVAGRYSPQIFWKKVFNRLIAS